MADEETQAQPKAKGGLSPMVIGAVAGLMILEGAAVAGFFMLAGGPKQAEASLEEGDPNAEASVEIELVKDQFQNMQTNRVWLWETEVYMKVSTANQEAVLAQLERRSAEIKSGVAEIVRRASHSQLREPGLETLSRQISAYVHTIFGEDAEGEPRIERVIIAKCKGFPADF